MKIHLFYLLITVLFFYSCKHDVAVNQEPDAPRLIITTDIGGDPDDQQSLVRLLLYANEFRIEGLIASASGTINELKKDTVQTGLIEEIVDSYEQVYPFLQKHSASYSDPQELRSKIKTGNKFRGSDYIGKGSDTEASDWIISSIDGSEEKTNICIWGGQTDIAQALWKVKQSRSKEDYLYFLSKIRIYDINDQDGLYSDIRKEHPALFYILAKAPNGKDKREGAYRGMYLGGDEYLCSEEWMEENMQLSNSVLGKKYPGRTWTSPNPYGFLKEGDTPSWFYFLKNNLQDPDHPEWGGWGGRFESDSAGFYRDAEDFSVDGIHARATVYRWREVFQNDFAARMKWCTMNYEEANHHPVVIIEGLGAKAPVFLEVNAGETIRIDASSSFDPDGDELNYYWWTYPEPGSNEVCPELENNLGPEVEFIVPDEPGKDLHLICQLSDTGKPSLTAFMRIVLKIN